MINSVALTGRLTRDLELRYTQSGTAVGSFTLAVDRQYKREGEPSADFINCVVWQKKAENLAAFTKKGSLIGIEGHIQTRNYEKQDGSKVFVTEVVLSNFALLESKQAGSNGQNSTQATQNVQTGGNDQPQPQTAQAAPQPATDDPFAGSSKQIDASDDDLPF